MRYYPFPPFQKSKEEGKMFEIGCGISFSARRGGEDMCCAFSGKREGRRRRRPLLLSRYFFPSLSLVYGNLPEGTHAFLILCSLSPHCCLQRKEEKKKCENHQSFPLKKFAKTAILTKYGNTTAYMNFDSLVHIFAVYTCMYFWQKLGRGHGFPI